MALAKKDYDAQAAEEAFTKVRASFQGGHPFSKSDATVELLGMQVYAAIAQAHALEEIAKELKTITALWNTWIDMGGSHGSTGTAKKH